MTEMICIAKSRKKLNSAVESVWSFQQKNGRNSNKMPNFEESYHISANNRLLTEISASEVNSFRCLQVLYGAVLHWSQIEKMNRSFKVASFCLSLSLSSGHPTTLYRYIYSANFLHAPTQTYTSFSFLRYMRYIMQKQVDFVQELVQIMPNNPSNKINH